MFVYLIQLRSKDGRLGGGERGGGREAAVGGRGGRFTRHAHY